MIWFKKQAEVDASSRGDEIAPASLSIKFDENICQNKMQSLLNELNDKGGIEEYIQALSNKHELFHRVLSEEVIEELDRSSVETLLDTIFTARRKLPDILINVPDEVLLQQIKALIYGESELQDRLGNFVSIFETDNRKAKRAAWDFAAELLHFNAPEQYPHMSRWVWNSKELSGAYREFLTGSDTLSEIPLGGTPGDFEAVRIWLAEQLGEQGFYRDIHFMIDLLIAYAYAEYVLSMSKGMGMFGSQFGGAETEPLEFIVKLLGIDPPRKKGLSRLKKAVIH